MKKVFLLASVAALALGSCTSELDGPNMPDQTNYKSKIIVSNGNADSRTSIDQAGDYVWNLGDAIGIFNAIEDDATNAVFQYTSTTSGREGIFGGQTELLAQKSYYGYYPWAYGTEVASNVITLNIPASQNYNFAAAEWGGSFAQNTSPAVGYGTTEEANIGTFSFYPVASYIKIPVTGYTPDDAPITSIALQIYETGKTSTDAVNIAGEYTVNMEEFAEVKDETNPYLATGIELTGEETTITLNLGKGVTLSDEITWFWFVVPANLTLSGQTVAITFNDGQTLTREIAEATTAVTTKRNTPSNIWADTAKNPFVYSPKNTAVIQKSYQFLEYVNLVTNGVQSTVTAYNTMMEKNPGQASYSYLPSMLNGATIADDGTITPGTAVNPALLVNDIEFSVEDIEKYIGSGQGIITGSGELDPYFSYLQDFIDNNGALSQSIGGEATFTMTGANVGTPEAPVYAAIDGLTVNGKGFIASATSTYQANLTNLVLANVTVDATEETEPYYFLCQTGSGSGNTITGVTVQNTCKLLPETDSKGALFNTVTSVGINSLDVTNESGLLYAYSLNVNGAKGFDFTAIEGAAVEDFQIICVTTNGAKSILYVEDAEEAEALLDVVLNNGTSVTTSTKFITTGSGCNPFSVVDKQEKPTSYWTGTICFNSTDDVTTAETLANAVQYYKTHYELELQNNIDLRNLDWWTSNDRPYTEPITVTGNGNTISKVNINTNKAGQQYMTMFGASSILSELTIEDITIDNSDEDAQNAYVAALSWVPGTSEKTSGVTVNGLTVIVDKAQGNVMGGLYATLGTDQLNALEDLTLTDVTLTPGEGIYAGNLAGLLGLTTNATTVKITNPLATMEVEGDLFGTQSLNVTPFAGGTTLTLVDFPVPFFSANQINALEGTNEGALLIIKQGTNQTIYTYDGKAYVAE